MADNFFDTSALGKHYHAEVGSPKVDALLANPGSRQFISRLTVVEIQSVFADKGADRRSGPGRLQTPLPPIQRGHTAPGYQVVRLLATHFQNAERLIRRLAPTHNLRTLDAIQLAVALDPP